jgi:hypothetical protein
VGGVNGSPENQVAYLNAIHDQLGPRLAFWVNTLLTDINIDSYAEQMKKDGRNPQDAFSLADRSPKPALEVWDGFRNEK